MDAPKRQFDVLGHLASLRRYARSLVRNPVDAEDLVHDALVKAYERRQTFTAGGNLKTWLLSIVHNAHVDSHRARHARQRMNEQAALELPQPQPAGQEHSVRLGQVRAAFLNLPEDQREALYMVAIEDLSYEEAAAALKIPIGTLMSRVSRARARLRSFEDASAGAANLRLIEGGK
jgi:RNA polymerase sigma-70 factor (ECF subfamily)